jgi:hypothetical protein
MIIEIFNELIDMGEQIINSQNPKKCSQEYLQFSEKVEYFRDFTLKDNPFIQYKLQDIFRPNGYDLGVGFCSPEDIKSYTQRMVSKLKIAKEYCQKEKIDLKKDNIFQIEQNISQSNFAQNIGGAIQGDFNYSNNKEMASNFFEWILKFPAFIFKLIIKLIKRWFFG